MFRMLIHHRQVITISFNFMEFVLTCSPLTLLKLNKYLFCWWMIIKDIYKNLIVQNEKWEIYFLPNNFLLHCLQNILLKLFFVIFCDQFFKRVFWYNCIWQNLNMFSNSLTLHFSFKYFGLHQTTVNLTLNQIKLYT